MGQLGCSSGKNRSPADRHGNDGNDLAAVVSAAQIVAVQRVLARRNWQALVDGAGADDLYPVARAEADGAFARLALG